MLCETDIVQVPGKSTVLFQSINRESLNIDVDYDDESKTMTSTIRIMKNLMSSENLRNQKVLNISLWQNMLTSWSVNGSRLPVLVHSFIHGVKTSHLLHQWAYFKYFRYKEEDEIVWQRRAAIGVVFFLFLLILALCMLLIHGGISPDGVVIARSKPPPHPPYIIQP